MEKIIQLDSNEVRDGTEGGRSPTGVPSLTSSARVAEGGESPTVAAENGSPVPDPAVSEHPVRRRFTAEYKARILREADRTAPGGRRPAAARGPLRLAPDHLATPA